MSKQYTVADVFADFNYLGGNFKEWFCPMPFNKKAKTKKLFSKKLPRMMTDQEIQNELKPTEVSVEEIRKTIENKDVWYLFYCRDKDNVLRAVDVGWNDVGWYAYAAALDDYGWCGDGRVFSRNSFDSSAPPNLKPNKK